MSNCAYCGKKFISDNRAKKFCKNQCTRAASAARRLEARKGNIVFRFPKYSFETKEEKEADRWAKIGSSSSNEAMEEAIKLLK